MSEAVEQVQAVEVATQERRKGLNEVEFIKLQNECESWAEFEKRSGMLAATAQQRAVTYRKVYPGMLKTYKSGGVGRKRKSLAEVQAALAAATGEVASV
jgi:hypothetical protein